MTQVVPIRTSEEVVEKVDEVEDNKNEVVDDNNNDNDSNGNETHHCIKSLSFQPEHHLGHFGEEHKEAQDIHDKFHIHEEGLRNKTAKQQEHAKCKTQLHLQARIKLKDSKALHQLPAFAALTDAEVDTIIDVMDHIVRYKGASICHQHDVSDSFYVIVKGAASVEVDDENKVTGEIVMDDTGLRPKQVEVNKLCSLKFFGESALIDGEEAL